MKEAVVAGAAGFVGYHLTKVLSDKGYRVYAIVRPGSEHNKRIENLPNVNIIDADIEKGAGPEAQIPEGCDYFFDLVWKPAGRYDYPGQMESAYTAFKMLETAAQLGCRRFVGIGSQAEYGATDDVIREDETPLAPFCGYGAAKIAASYMTRKRAQELDIEWIWGRIFSIYGLYEPKGRLLPHLIDSFLNGQDVTLSSCRQNWDFLYGSDAGEALLAMAENGKNGEIYNIADGRYRPLRTFVEDIARQCRYKGTIHYGEDPTPFVSLSPSMEKLMNDTGWVPKVSFEEGIRELLGLHNDQ